MFVHPSFHHVQHKQRASMIVVEAGPNCMRRFSQPSIVVSSPKMKPKVHTSFNHIIHWTMQLGIKYFHVDESFRMVFLSHNTLPSPLRYMFLIMSCSCSM